MEDFVDVYKTRLPEDIRESYNFEILGKKWKFLPEYVKEWDSDCGWDPKLLRVASRKWGRRDRATSGFVETPGIIFFRAAMYATNDAKTKDPSLNFDKILQEKFYLFANGEIMINTPYMANAGHPLIADYLTEKIGNQEGYDDLKIELEEEKPQSPQTSACFVLGIKDDLGSIMETLTHAAIIHKYGGGTGFNFSRLRPSIEPIRKSGGYTDGPLSFVSSYSTFLATLNQGGRRKGANMAIMNVDHPDIIKFIFSKIVDKELEGVNISVGATSEFMNVYRSSSEEGSYYRLRNPHHNLEDNKNIPKYYSESQLKGALRMAKYEKDIKPSFLLDENETKVLIPSLPVLEGLNIPDELRSIGVVKQGEVYLNAKKVMKLISILAHYKGDPGIVFLDRINQNNPTHPRYLDEVLSEAPHLREEMGISKKRLEELLESPYYGDSSFLPVGVGVIESTNPCGEQPLLSYESCILGHVNWEKILVEASTEKSGYNIDWEELKQLTYEVCDILDNSIDSSDFVLPQVKKIHQTNRKIGMGFMGMAHLLAKLEIAYDSQEGRDLVSEIWRRQVEYSVEFSQEKAKRYGAFPNFKFSKWKDGPEMRNATLSTVAPTGTCSTIVQTSGGVEPIFALWFTRETAQGEKIKVVNPILMEKLDKYHILTSDAEKGGLENIISKTGSLKTFELTRRDLESASAFEKRKEDLDYLKRIFRIANEISPDDHVKSQAVIQRWTHNAVSKTTNFSKGVSPGDIERVYDLADRLECMGITVYREGSRERQPLTTGCGEYKKRGFMNGTRPTSLEGCTRKVNTGQGNLYVTINKDEGGDTVEVFANIGKSGGDTAALAEAIGRLISISLQKGVKQEEIAYTLMGITGSRPIWNEGVLVKSVPDAIGQALLGHFDKKKKEEKPDSSEEEISLAYSSPVSFSGIECPECGGRMIMESGCSVCHACGHSSCG